MAIEKFRFVSPGVQINEIDDSVLAPTPPAIGPVVIGRTAKGPAMQPVQVSTVAELEKVFGPTSNGIIGAADVWRTAIPTSPTLATYAAKAFLQNSTPVTVVRLAGVDKNGGSDEPGWTVNGNVYGLFTVSGTLGMINGATGSLAGIIYTNATTTVNLLNSALTWSVNSSASMTADKEFYLKVSGASTTSYYTASLQSNSGSFLRNLLNTNPTRFSTANVAADLSQNYFLGETFESSVSASHNLVYLAQLSSSFKTFEAEAESAESGYVISDHTTNEATDAINLFKFVALNGGASVSRDIKISIENVRASKNENVTKYGTFDVVVRKLFEPVGTQVVLERFAGVNLDVNSSNFIARRIGDSYREWDMTNSRYVEYGSFPNRSSYLRVQMAEASNGVAVDIPATALPHGFRMKGRPVFTGLTAISVTYPNIDLLKPTASQINASTAKSTRFGLKSHPANNADLVDILRQKPIAGNVADDTVFSTRYVAGTDTGYKTYVAGTRNSLNLLTEGYILGFDMPMYGGSDGTDITEAEPFINEFLLDDTTTELNSAPYRAIKAAIDLVANPEVLDMNVLCVPGLKNESLTSHMIDVCKARGDAMAIIDLKGDYKYAYETNNNIAVRPQNTTDVITNLTGRAVDNSYGAAYFPAVFVQSEGIYMPASIAALGAFGGTEGRSALWFAPAGFNRGGLTEANSGIGVSKTALQLTSTDRDNLYEVNINPIATFPGEGVVIFGQKTLQVTPSALDRVNVRRLLNFIKKQISRAATRVLFEPNVQDTWNNFKGVVDPFLLGIKNAYGLDDARVILDSSTTTADLVDRNIMYCKILIKPTRAIEFIAIDFVVTNSGAAFTEQ